MPTKKVKQPLSVTHPELAKEADGWDPELISAGSNKKLLWRCAKDHNWSESPNKRAGRGFGCPFCSGNRVLVGFNDLATTHVALSIEAFEWDPTSLSQGSNKRVAWKCSEGHIWVSPVARRAGSQKSGCPYCSGQKVLAGLNDLQSRFPEIALQADGWDPTAISSGSNKKMKWICSLGHHWVAAVSSRTSMGTGCPVCNNLKISIGYNDLATTHPMIASQADEWDPQTVVAGTAKRMPWICAKGHKWKSSVNHRTERNQGCPFCSNKRLLKGFNDLATTHPDLATEALDWDPTEVNAGRSPAKNGRKNEKRKWKCLKGHIYEATPASRTNSHHQSGCPVCTGNQILTGFNDLATTHPDLATEALDWDPTKFVSSGKKKFKWKCLKGHIWSQTIQERKSGSGCPSCAKSGFDPNRDGYFYLIIHPDWGMQQIGITNQPKIRLGTHKRLGWELIELRGPMDGHLAQQWETAILRMLKAKGADLSNGKIAGKFDGYSEAWSKGTFEAKSIKELIRLTEEFEEK